MAHFPTDRPDPSSSSPSEPSGAIPPTSEPPYTRLRFVCALLIGLLGSVFIWVVTPYNNFVLNSAYISDSSLPVAALFVIVLIVLLANPLLRLFSPRLVLTSRQLALALGIMLVASVLPGQGLLRELPYCVAKTPQAVRQSGTLAEGYRQMRLPSALYPDKFDDRTDDWVTDRFLSELLPGESIPWGAWVGPLLSWGAFLLFAWMMMVGMGLIVFPQWRRNERLAFPLLLVHQSLVGEPEKGRIFPPLLRRRAFWYGVVIVFLLHLLSGLRQYSPESVPAIPLSWNLNRLFTDGILREIPDHIYTGRIYFIFMAVAFFMPSRIGLSVWFFTVAYALHKAIAKTVMPPYYGGIEADHRTGAMVAITLVVLWLGRAQWARVLGLLVRPARSDDDRRDRNAGWMFVSGCVGMYAWLVFFFGISWGWGLVFVGFAFMTALVISRLVAETGMPFMRLDVSQHFPFLYMANPAGFHPATLLFSYFMVALFTICSRISAATMATHAFGVDAKSSPREQTRLSWILVGTLVLGLVVCGASHLWCSYHYADSLDGRREYISTSGVGRLDRAHKAVEAFVTHGEVTPLVQYSHTKHLLFGAAVAGGLHFACLASPRFPLHPIGLLIAGTYYANWAWASIFIGWLLKVLVLRYGGARLYRRAMPLFIGFIMGETFATIFWSLVSPIRYMLTLEYLLIQIQPQ
ncbi:hypothetical protein JW916_06405 [Candidatus Sumerlaeota bacterium]|nr:hypothetical protein [Candidatus Sumerlaeota bacterium]